MTEDEAHATEADLDAQIAHLQALKAGRTAPKQTEQAPASLPADPYRDPEADPFAFAKLTEKQAHGLHEAGFTTRQHVERASDDEVLDALGGGKGSEAALARLRGG